MKREQLIARIGPCGQDCAQCLNNPASSVAEHARSLWRALDMNGGKAGWRSQWDAVCLDYAAFERVLARFADGGCAGCRTGNGPGSGCEVRECTLEKGVVFCHECADFPCEAKDMVSAQRKRWLNNNERIREVGLEAFFERMRSE